MTAHQGRLHCDPLTDHGLVHILRDGDHHTDHFMAGIVRRLEERVLAVGTGLIRSAHTRYQHLDQRFARPKVRYRLPDHLDNVGCADKDSSAGPLA
jgi:hypothetical protein